MAKGRPGRRRSTLRTNNPQKVYSVRLDLETGNVVLQLHDRDELEDINAYIRAHRLIPRDYEYGCDASQAMVAEAIATLKCATVETPEVLASLAVLGHSPCDEALAALNEYVDTDRPYAKVARYALEECFGLSEAWCA